MKTVALLLFVYTYALLLALPKWRSHVAVASAALFVALGIVPLSGLAQAIDWNVIMMIAGTMGTVWFFILSGMPALLADRILRRVRTVQWATVSLAFFSGLISALMDNVATMLPVASGIAQIMGVDAFLLYFGIMVGATLGGNLTPIGASANITGIGLLRKEGYTVRTVDFLRIGVPSTLTAVVIGYVLIWLIYG